MKHPTGGLKVTTLGDREIVMTREFAAPRELVWEAYTKPELVKRWLGVMDGWAWAVCEIDLRPGGRYRYLWHGPDKMQMGMGGTYKEIQAPSRIVCTELFDEAWYSGGEALDTLTLVERGGITTLTLTVQYPSREARDEVLKSPATEGVGAGFDNLERLLDERKAAKA